MVWGQGRALEEERAREAAWGEDRLGAAYRQAEAERVVEAAQSRYDTALKVAGDTQHESWLPRNISGEVSKRLGPDVDAAKTDLDAATAAYRATQAASSAMGVTPEIYDYVDRQSKFADTKDLPLVSLGLEGQRAMYAAKSPDSDGGRKVTKDELMGITLAEGGDVLHKVTVVPSVIGGGMLIGAAGRKLLTVGVTRATARKIWNEIPGEAVEEGTFIGNDLVFYGRGPGVDSAMEIVGESTLQGIAMGRRGRGVNMVLTEDDLKATPTGRALLAQAEARGRAGPGPKTLVSRKGHSP